MRRSTDTTAESSAASASRSYQQQQRAGMASPSSSSNDSSNGSGSNSNSRMMKVFHSSFDNKSFENAVGSLKVSQRNLTSSPTTTKKDYPKQFTEVKKETFHVSPGHQVQSFSYNVTDALTNANRLNGGRDGRPKQDESSLVDREVKRTRRVSPS